MGEGQDNVVFFLAQKITRSLSVRASGSTDMDVGGNAVQFTVLTCSYLPAHRQSSCQRLRACGFEESEQEPRLGDVLPHLLAYYCFRIP